MQAATHLSTVTTAHGRRAIATTIFWAAFLFASLAIFVPLLPQMPGEGLDPSWMVAMNEAVAQRLVFGRDVVFTFGPYAAIYTKVYHPATDGLMLWGSLYLGLTFALATYLAFRGKSLWLPALLAISLPLLLYARDSLFFFHPLLVAVAVFRGAYGKAGLPRWGVARYALLFILFTPLGLYPLIKGSTLASCGAIVALCALALAGQKQWKAALLVCATPLISLLAFWLAAGQPLAALPAYFTSMAPIISGYTEAMFVQGNRKEIIAYLLACIALLWVVARHTPDTPAQKWLMSLAFMAVLFLALKAGFVRHDAHAVISGAMLIVAAVLAGAVARRTGYVPMGFAVVAGIYICMQHLGLTPRHYYYITQDHYARFIEGCRQRVGAPGKLDTDYKARLAELKAKAGFPAMEGSVDIFSHDQSYLIASGMQWQPRPVPQSYSVYTPYLAEQNRRHMESNAAPDNVIFRIQAIDGRLPALEDGAVWPVLLSQYRLNSFRNGYLFLKRKSNARGAAQLTPLARGTYAFRSEVTVPESPGLTVARIDMRPTLAGKLLGTLFKPRPVRIHLRLANGGERSYRFVPGMGRTEFLLSPNVERTEEFGLLFANAGLLEAQRVKTISLTHRGPGLLWKDDIHVEFDSLSHEQDPSSLKRMGEMGLAEPVDESHFRRVETAARCEGNIEAVNGIVPAPTGFNAGVMLEAHGWLVRSTAEGLPAESVYGVLSGRNERLFIAAEQFDRTDVGSHFGNPNLNRSGFRIRANVQGVEGQYTLGLAYGEGDIVSICHLSPYRSQHFSAFRSH